MDTDQLNRDDYVIECDKHGILNQDERYSNGGDPLDSICLHCITEALHREIDTVRLAMNDDSKGFSLYCIEHGSLVFGFMSQPKKEFTGIVRSSSSSSINKIDDLKGCHCAKCYTRHIISKTPEVTEDEDHYFCSEHPGPDASFFLRLNPYEDMGLTNIGCRNCINSYLKSLCKPMRMKLRQS